MYEQNINSNVFLMIDNNWFNKMSSNTGLPSYGYINKYGHNGLLLYSLIKLNLTVDNYYIFTLRDIYNMLNINTRSDSRKIKEIKKLLQAMQHDEIIKCYNYKKELINFASVKNGELIYHIVENPISFTKIFAWEIKQILQINNLDADISMLFTMFAFIIKSLNSQSGFYSMDNNYIMNCTNIKSETSIIKYKKLLLNNKLIAVDNVGMLINGYITNKVSFKQYKDTYSRYEDKSKLQEYIKEYRSKQAGEIIKYGKRELSNNTRSLKLKLRWLNYNLVKGKISQEEFKIKSNDISNQIIKLKEIYSFRF